MSRQFALLLSCTFYFLFRGCASYPVTLKNYNDGQCGYPTPAWVQEALEAGPEADPMLYAAARNVLSYEAIDKRPYIHLLDRRQAASDGLLFQRF